MAYYPHRHRSPHRRPLWATIIPILAVVMVCTVAILFFIARGKTNTNDQAAGSPSPSSSNSQPTTSSSSSPTPSSSPETPSVSPSPSQSATPAPSPSPSQSTTPAPSPSPSSSVEPAPSPSQSEKLPASDIPWYLTLVNAKHPLPEDFEPQLSQLPNGLYFDSRAADALMEMVNGCRAAGLKPVIGSAYRSIDDQIYLHNRKINYYLNQGLAYEAAYAEASTVVAIPGCSEHNLGLAVDLCALSYRILDEGQEKTAEQQWFMAHCHEYGFILRYQSEKSDLTGIIYEPWHYRYVGKEAAIEITESGVCLEEYIASRYGLE